MGTHHYVIPGQTNPLLSHKNVVNVQLNETGQRRREPSVW